MARGFSRKEEREREKIAAEKILYHIPPNAVRSIEELARLSREVKGLGIGYLSKSQLKWLYYGGEEYLKVSKPLIYKLIQEMKGVHGAFPVNLREVAEYLQERIRKKAKKGEVDEKWKRIVITASEVESILRFKRDPFFSKGEKTELMVDTLVEVLEEMYREEKKRHRKEEPEIKVALEVAKIWQERFRKVKEVVGDRS